jgi:hypothetical protein
VQGAELDALVRAIIDRSEFGILIRQIQGVAKVALPFSASWGNFGGGNEGATYSRIGRLVVLQGLVTKSGGTPADGDVIATLPSGFRPTEALMFPVVTGATITFGRVSVVTSGEIRWRLGSTAETDFTSLSGVSFVVD